MSMQFKKLHIEFLSNQKVKCYSLFSVFFNFISREKKIKRQWSHTHIHTHLVWSDLYSNFGYIFFSPSSFLVSGLIILKLDKNNIVSKHLLLCLHICIYKSWRGLQSKWTEWIVCTYSVDKIFIRSKLVGICKIASTIFICKFYKIVIEGRLLLSTIDFVSLLLINWLKEIFPIKSNSNVWIE